MAPRAERPLRLCLDPALDVDECACTVTGSRGASIASWMLPTRFNPWSRG